MLAYSRVFDGPSNRVKQTKSALVTGATAFAYAERWADKWECENRVSKLERVEKGGRIEWVQPEGTHFVTVDLDVFSRTRLTELARAFGDSVLVLHEGRWGSRYCASFELSNSWQLSADQETRRLVSLVRGLPPLARRLWRGAQSRVFDIGVEAGLTPHSHALALSQDAVEGVANVQGRITVTTYAPDSRPVPPPSSRKRGAAQRAAPGGQRVGERRGRVARR
jgi:hypothetical protein